MTNNKLSFLFGAILLISLVGMVPFVLADPNGANVTVGASSSAGSDPATSNGAMAGNVTELTVSGITITQSWQGYFGNVTGVIQLADSSDNVLYNWSQSSPQGEVYASINDTVYWSNIQCLNFTASGAYGDESGAGGTTNLEGMNLSTLHSQFGIVDGDADAVNATFNLIGAGTHDPFFAASQEFTEGECANTRIFDNTGAGVNNKFEEVLLYEPVSASVVFASLMEQDADGFDQRTHDFQMLVLENGHGLDVTATPYYFFVELQ